MAWHIFKALSCLASTHFAIAKQTEQDTQTSEQSWTARRAVALWPSESGFSQNCLENGLQHFSVWLHIRDKFRKPEAGLWLPGQPTTAGSFLSWSQHSVSNRCSLPALWPVYRLHPFFVYFDIEGKMLLCIRFPGVGSFRDSERFHSSERGKKKRLEQVGRSTLMGISTCYYLGMQQSVPSSWNVFLFFTWIHTWY